jgi:hypothetical protein
VAGGKITFRVRALRGTTSLEDLWKIMMKETDQRIPEWRDLKVFKEGNPYDGLWTSGHFQLVHKSLPVPASATSAVAVKSSPAVFGIWGGKKFKSRPPIDISAIAEDERLTIFNRVHPIGRDVRYHVGKTEELSVSLRPGQPYSVYPMIFTRSNESKEKVKDSAPPVRVEGPFLNVQWTVIDASGNPIVLTTTSLAPQEVTLLQFWKKFAEQKYRGPVTTIEWGHYHRWGDEIESRVVTTLEESDSLEIVIRDKKKKVRNGDVEQAEVTYTLGEEPQVYRCMMRKDPTIGQIREVITLAHKGSR